MTNMCSPLEQGIYFEKSISDSIVKVMLSPKRVSWKKEEGLLDEIIRQVIMIGYTAVPGIKKRLDDAGVSPDKITSFRDYERLLPWISVPEILNLGQSNFELRADKMSQSHPDFAAVGRYILEERIGSTKYTFTPVINGADARAVHLALGGELLRANILAKEVLVNQKDGVNSASDFLNHLLIPAFKVAGITPLRIPTMTARESGKGLLLPPPNRRIIEDIGGIGGLQNFGTVFRADGQFNGGNEFHLGKYDSPYGIFPSLGSTFSPLIVRAVGADGTTLHSGNQPYLERGRIVVDRLFAAYEIPTNWSLLKGAISQAMDSLVLCKLEFTTVKRMEHIWGGNYPFRNEFYKVLHEAGMGQNARLNYESLRDIYSKVLQQYLHHSVRIGAPTSTWLLRVGFQMAAKVGDNGVIHSAMKLSPGMREAYVSNSEWGAKWGIRYGSSEAPYIANIVGSKGKFPGLVNPHISLRVHDVLRGFNHFGRGSHGYTYSVSLVTAAQFNDMLEAALAYASQAPKSKTTLKDIMGIMSELHNAVKSELEKVLSGNDSMIKMFLCHTKIPISEVKDMVAKAREDFIDCNGLGIKRIAYAAFVNPAADIPNLPDEELSKGIIALSKAKARTPSFMVTPGNITIYDAFYILSHVLMAKLSEQSEGNFTMYIKPSQSDIAFNFLVYHFNKIAERIDPNNEKGLRTMFQKAYWDSNKDSSMLNIGMRNAQAGVYFGKASTYSAARFNEALASADGYNSGEKERLYKIAEKAGFKEVGSIAAALSEGINKPLVEDVRKFISRHFIYSEAINAHVILPDCSKEDVRPYARAFLKQVYSNRSTDCTNASNLWVHKDIYGEFMHIFEEEAGKLTVGSPMNSATKLAQYDSSCLKKTKAIVESDKGITRIIAPTDAETGKRLQSPINPQENYTGVIVTNLDAKTLIGNPQNEDILDRISNQSEVPWINIITYSSANELGASMRAVREKYMANSGYPRFLYVAAIGGDSLASFGKSITDITDLFKPGAKAQIQIIPYKPHQGRFIIRTLTK